jgi:hypothetical protein
MQTMTTEKLQQIIEKQQSRITELEAVLILVRDTYDNLTTPQFQRGADKAVREEVARVLARNGSS